jgi:M3 family oligoendopeptidase
MNYKYYNERPGTLTPEFITEEYGKILAEIPKAEASSTDELWFDLFTRWNALDSFITSEGSRIHHELSKDMNDPVREEREMYFQKEVLPVSEKFGSQMVGALLKSSHLTAIGNRFGSHLLNVIKPLEDTLNPVNSALRVAVNALITKYDKIVASGEVTVGGKQVTLSVARSLQTSHDPVERKESYEAYRKWFLEHRVELGTIYAEMVKLRDEMGRNLGYKNFIPLGYKGMGRTDYGVEEAAQFRANVRKYLVPLQTKLFEMQAERLGTPTLKPWDGGFDPSTSLPAHIAPIDEQLDKAQRIFDKLSPTLAAHFMRMRSEGLIDLENRKGKRAGAYCTSFPDEGRVAILCNSTGESEDIRTLTHEMGHAFQGWESQPIEATMLQWPTSDACEIHSMGMEFLSMRYIEEYFSPENAEKYRRKRWRDAVEMMCYIVIVDEFQHWVYENPNASLDERDAAWSRIWDIYKPGIDFTGCQEYKYARWYAQGHIFAMPFYYIDYAIAETGAMQLALLDDADHTDAVEKYLELCRIGGTKSVLNIFAAVGMRSPFEENLMRDLTAHAEKILFAPEAVEV